MVLVFRTTFMDVAVALATCLTIAYLYFGRTFKYWEKRGVNYLKPTVVFGNMLSVALKQIHIGEFFQRIYEENPDHPVVGIFLGQKPALVVRDLDLVRSVMIKDAHIFLDRSVEPSDGNSLSSRNLFVLKGKMWKYMRVKLTPTFTSGKIKKMFYLINECGKELIYCIDKEMSTELEDDDIVAQAFIFILAGFETSSSVISFALFELALHPDIQDQLRRETKSVLDKHNSEVTYDAIAEMHYLEMVVSETLRLHPTIPNLERKCLQNYKITGTNITIEKGTSVNIPVLGIHIDPAIYPDPGRFDPERFSAENKSKRSNFAHMPFGEGPRICIGMRFGQMQVKTALVHILTTYIVKPCAETPTPPLGLKPSSNVNTPRKDIILAFHKIK